MAQAWRRLGPIPIVDGLSIHHPSLLLPGIRSPFPSSSWVLSSHKYAYGTTAPEYYSGNTNQRGFAEDPCERPFEGLREAPWRDIVKSSKSIVVKEAKENRPAVSEAGTLQAVGLRKTQRAIMIHVLAGQFQAVVSQIRLLTGALLVGHCRPPYARLYCSLNLDQSTRVISQYYPN